MRWVVAWTGRLALGALAPLALGGCSGTQGDEPPATDGEEIAATASASASPSGEPAPEAFAATAWRALAADGARYTTYLDADGTYRDLRNGDPWQTGSWRYLDAERDRRLCFMPADENGIERCWEPGRMTGETLRAKSDHGLTIELERVEYQPPVEPDDADEEA